MADENIYEYRVVWKRKDQVIAGNDDQDYTQVCRRKTRKYSKLEYAERRLQLIGPEPWKAFPATDPDEIRCCDGYQCNCQGETWRESLLREREEMPKIDYAHIERREIGNWEKLQ